jgi:hypothetical protein
VRTPAPPFGPWTHNALRGEGTFRAVECAVLPAIRHVAPVHVAFLHAWACEPAHGDGPASDPLAAPSRVADIADATLGNIGSTNRQSTRSPEPPEHHWNAGTAAHSAMGRTASMAERRRRRFERMAGRIGRSA